ncbi:MAG: VOC family protein [Bacteroidia bacterium]|nr:VOC family protein [Bacteroidia bacterium]
MIEGLEHVGLSVSNLDKSIDFYCKNLQCEVIRIIEANTNPLLGKVVGMPGCVARIAHLRSGPNMLELFEYTAPNGKKIPKDFRQADNGFVHAGFRSSDVRNDYSKLKNEGVVFISEPVEFRKDVWICYFYGPDHEVCELRES